MTLHGHGGQEKHVAALEFLKTLFGHTEQPIFFQSLANDPGDEAEARFRPVLLTRDLEPIIKFIAKHDRNRRGTFFCVATVNEGASTRNKETARETVCLHADLDFKGIVEDEPTIRAEIAKLRCPPTIIVRSGGGLHLYWVFREAIDSQEYREVIEIALKAVAEIVAGDPAVCDVCRLMRLPGTFNSKRGDMREVVVERLDGPRYELEELEEWISEQQPVLTRKVVDRPTKKDAQTQPEQTGDNPLPPARPAMGLQAPPGRHCGSRRDR